MATARGKQAADFTSSVKLQNITFTDGSVDALNDYTFNLGPDTFFIEGWGSGYAADKVLTTTDYNYGSSITLLALATARGKQAANFDSTVKLQNITFTDGSVDALNDYTFNLGPDTFFIAGWGSG